MAWRSDEVWLDTDVLWFREQPRLPFAAYGFVLPALAAPVAERFPFAPVQTGLEASLQRRRAKQAARRRRLTTRTIPAVALVVGSATMLPIAALRSDGAQNAGPLREDPPSQSFRLNFPRLEVRAPGAPPRNASAQATAGSSRVPGSSAKSNGTRARRSGSPTQADSPTARSFPSRDTTG